VVVRAGLSALLCAGAVLAGMSDARLSLSLLARGNVEDARAHAIRGYDADSTVALNRFALARVTSDAVRACALYGSVAEKETAADSIRAAAHAALGEYHFVAGEYDTAAALFGRAAAVNGDPRYLDAKAVALLAAADTAGAEPLLVAAAAASDRGLFRLGFLFYARGRYEEALRSFGRGGESGDPSIAAPSLAMAAASATLARKGEEAAGYAAELSHRFPFVLERDLLPSVEVPAGRASKRRADLAEVTEVDEPVGGMRGAAGGRDGRYTIQVGAFGRVENARRLRAELGERFGTVTVVAEPGGTGTLHKVRIGAFDSEQKALDYGERMLRPLGMSFRVVKE
jgi:tetratricopeptide (TPR) repeat protein